MFAFRKREVRNKSRHYNVSLQPKYGSATHMNLFRENAREMCITQSEPSNVVFPRS